jgi:hypothetical protein
MRIRIRIGSGFNEILDPYPDPDSQSESEYGSRRAKKPTKVDKVLKNSFF